MSATQRILNPEDHRRAALAGVTALIVIALDALTKWLVVRELGPSAGRPSVSLVGEFVELRYATNGGVAFGLFSSSPLLAVALVAVVIVPLVIILLILAGRGTEWAVGVGLVLGGALGNLIDRIGDRTVTDFVSVGRWPSFNLADSAITVGALLLIVMSVRDRDEHLDQV